MKKTKKVLLTLLACSTILVTCGSANFASAFSQWDQFIFPSYANYDPPSIVIYTPIQNETHNLADLKSILNINLNFTITKNSRGQLLSVWYALDDNEKVFVDAKDSDDPYNSNFVFKFTIRLHAGCGVHSLEVGAEEKSYYICLDENEKYVLNSVNVSAVSEPVIITINPPPTATPTETQTPQTQNQPVLGTTEHILLVSLAVVAVVAPVLLYSRQRKNANLEFTNCLAYFSEHKKLTITEKIKQIFANRSL